MKQSIHILQINIDGIRAKKTELAKILDEYKVDLACIQETRLTPKVDFNLSNYTIIRKDRTIGRKGHNSNNAGGGIGSW